MMISLIMWVSEGRAAAADPGREGRPRVNSTNDMVGPGLHEDNTASAIARGQLAEAQVHAILALASAVNRLAAAHEALAARQA